MFYLWNARCCHRWNARIRPGRRRLRATSCAVNRDPIAQRSTTSSPPPRPRAAALPVGGANHALVKKAAPIGHGAVTCHRVPEALDAPARSNGCGRPGVTFRGTWYVNVIPGTWVV